MANPVGTGPYRLKEWRRGQRIVLEANPGYRDERYPAADRSRRSRARREARRAASCRSSAASRSRSSRNRIRACSRSSSGDLDYVAGAGRSRAERARPGQPAEAELRAAGRDACARRAAGDQLHVLQHGGPGRRRLHAGARSRCAARSRMAYNVDEEIRVLRQGQGAPATQIDSAEHDRPRPDARRPRQATTPAAQGAARQVRLHRPRRRRLARHAGRQAAGAEDGVADDDAIASSTSCGSAA